MATVKELQYEELCMEALGLRMKGLVLREIADEMGGSLSTAKRRIERAQDLMRPHADYDFYRGRQLAEIAEIRSRLYRAATDDDRPLDEQVSAVDRLLKVHDRESKLLALDKAPTPLEEAARLLAATDAAEVARELSIREAESAQG